MPKFSVVMCNYNYERYIAQSVQSVLGQSCSDFELIIVDDGSTDQSRSIIDGFTDKRIKKIFKRNGGQASAFNAAFAESTGELVAFLDSDDFWAAGKLTAAADVFRNSDCVAFYHRLAFVDSDSTRTGGFHPASGCIEDTEMSLLADVFLDNEFVRGSPTSSIVFRRWALENVFPLDAGWRYCADMLLWLGVLYGGLFCSSSVLGYYRVHGGNGWWDTVGVDSKRHAMQRAAYRQLQVHLEKSGCVIKPRYVLSPQCRRYVRFRFGYVIFLVFAGIQYVGRVLYRSWVRSALARDCKVLTLR